MAAATEDQSMDYQIKEKDKGLFVSIKQLQHKFSWDGNTRIKTLNYTPDEERFLKVFNLQKTDLIAEDLTNTDGTRGFDEFMERVCSKPNPAFVMFFLMSHGRENGDFLLARRSDDTSVPEGPCCVDLGKGKHTTEKQCFARNIVKHIINKVNEAYPYRIDPTTKKKILIPKIFIIQCCRGNTGKNIEGQGEQSDIQPSDIELFVPHCEDTLIFYAVTEGYTSLVYYPHSPKLVYEGSLLIQYFCEALEDLQNTNEEYEQLLNKVRGHEMQQDVLRKLNTSREDITGGWIMNVCQRTTALVTNFIRIEIILPLTDLGQLLKDPKTKDTIYADGDVIRTELMNDFLGHLKAYKGVTQYESSVDAILTACHEQQYCDLWAILLYMWRDTSGAAVAQPLKVQSAANKHKSITLEYCLNIIISEIQSQHPENSLRKLLSQPDIDDRISIEKCKEKLFQKMLSSLTKYKSHPSCQHQAEVDRIITACNANQRIHGFVILRYLWYNVRCVTPTESLQAPSMPADEKSRLEKDLNKILDDIQNPKPYSKQQPHISSSLCMKLSCIKLLNTQQV